MIRRWGGMLGAAGWALFSAPAWSAGTPAGTAISNTATAAYRLSGAPQTQASNTVTLTVAEALDVTVVSNDPGNVSVTSPDTDAPLFFTVTNTGNGSEAFELRSEAVSGDDFDPANPRIYLDDGDGAFNPGSDTLYVFNGNDPVLAPDASIGVFIVSNIPADRPADAVGSRRLRATAVTAGTTGNPPGTVFPGRGTAGSDAVVGPSTASALAQGNYQVTVEGQATAALVKTQAVTGAGNELAAAPGAIVTYTLTLTVSGEGRLANARIVDPIPAGTSYVPGSLTLDSGSGPAALSDAMDADAGRFDTSTSPSPSRIDVQLGSIAAPATRIVTFQVTLD